MQTTNLDDLLPLTTICDNKTHNYKEVRNNMSNKNGHKELVGIGGWPTISTWINPPPLGSNGLHCIDFPYQVNKLLLYLAPSEPLYLV
jgi:hypothetical protein